MPSIITLRLDEKQSLDVERLKQFTAESSYSKAIMVAVQYYEKVSQEYIETSSLLHETRSRLSMLIQLSIDKERIDSEIEKILQGKK